MLPFKRELNMAVQDYKLCDSCGKKTFQDADIEHKFEEDKVGEMKVLCPECAKTRTLYIADKDNLKIIGHNIGKDQGYRECLKEIVLPAFEQACWHDIPGHFDHDHISAYEEMQRELLRYGLITKHQCKLED